jgi:signal transduction histidine kinase
MLMPRLENRSPPATGVPSASGTVMPGGCAACAFVDRRTRRCDVGDATPRSKAMSNLPAIAGDWVQLQQVVLNLTLNALQAMGPAGEALGRC